MRCLAIVVALSIASPAAAQPTTTSTCAQRLHETADALRLSLQAHDRCKFQLDTCHMREARLRTVVDNPPVPEPQGSSLAPWLVAGILIPLTGLAAFYLGMEVGR